MKNSFLRATIVAVITLFAFVRCDDEQDHRIINIEDTPQEIELYVATHFPANAVLNVTKDVNDRPITFRANLEGNIQLKCNEAKEVMEIDATTALPESVIPDAIRAYVTANYADRAITDWGLKNGEQSIELDNVTELVFDLGGNFLR